MESISFTASCELRSPNFSYRLGNLNHPRIVGCHRCVLGSSLFYTVKITQGTLCCCRTTPLTIRRGKKEVRAIYSVIQSTFLFLASLKVKLVGRWTPKRRQKDCPLMGPEHSELVVACLISSQSPLSPIPFSLQMRGGCVRPFL